MVVYESGAEYIECQTTLRDKIAAIDNIIDALLLTAAKSAANDHISEYSLNDGQTQIRSAYKGADQVYQSIQAFERLKQMYVNRLNGRVVRLVDSKNLIGYCNGNR